MFNLNVIAKWSEANNTGSECTVQSLRLIFKLVKTQSRILACLCVGVIITGII